MNDYVKLFVTVVLSVVVTPFVFESVSQAMNGWLLASGVGVWNPGNGAGMLIGVAASSGAVFALASIASSLHHLDDRRRRAALLRGCIDWVAAIGMGSAVVVTTYRLVTYFHSMQLAAIFSIFVSALVGGMISRWKFPPYSFNPHVIGPKIVPTDDVKRHRGDRLVTCAPHGADYIEMRDEVRHYFIFGKTGGGKTTQLKMIMSALAPIPGLWAVADPKLEMVPFLKALGRNVIIFNPYDTRCVSWAIDKDIVNPALAMSVAVAIVPIPKEAREPHFPETAQGLVQGVCMFLIHRLQTTGRSWTLRDVILLCEDKELMKRAFMQLPTTRPLLESLKDGVAEQNSYLSTLTTSLRPWKIIAALWSYATIRVSMNDLVEQCGTSFDAIVYATDREEGEPLKELNRLLFEIQKQRVMNLPDDSRRRVRWFLDEVSNGSHHLGYSLAQFLAEGRSKGACFYLGSQDTAGMIQAFGKEATDRIWGQCQHRAIVGGVDAKTAQYVSDAIGEVTYIETETSFSQSKPAATDELGSSKAPDRGKDVSTQFTRKTRPLIPKEKLAEEFPLTTQENGLTGLFIGGVGGIHWYCADWSQVASLTVPDAPEVNAYDRIPRDSDRYYLKPFTDEELQSLGLL